MCCNVVAYEEDDIDEREIVFVSLFLFSLFNTKMYGFWSGL